SGDWSSDVCSSDLVENGPLHRRLPVRAAKDERVLEDDCALVGEVLDRFELDVGKRAVGAAGDGEDAEEAIPANERNMQLVAERDLVAQGLQPKLGYAVADADGLALGGRAPG